MSLAFTYTITAERDYIPLIEIVTFLSDEVTKTVDTFIIDDRNIEFDENFFLYLTSGEGVHLSPFSIAEVIIENDDGEDNLKLPTMQWRNYVCWQTDFLCEITH